MTLWIAVMGLYAVVLLGGGLLVTKRRIDRLEEKVKIDRGALEATRKVVHQDVIPLLRDQIQKLTQLEIVLDAHGRDHVVADDAGRLTKTKADPPQSTKQLAALRDDLVSLAKELEHPSARPGGVTATARTGARLLFRAASPRTRSRDRRPPKPS